MTQRHHRGSQFSHAPFILAPSRRTPERGCAGEKRGGGSRHTGSSKWSIMSGSRCGVGGHAVMNCFAPHGQIELHEPSVRAHTRARARTRSALIRVEGTRGLIRRAVPNGRSKGDSPLRHEKSVEESGDLWRSISQAAMAS